MACHTALLSAAVKAACQARAPQRTVAAVAAAVTAVLVQPVTSPAPAASVTGESAGSQGPEWESLMNWRENCLKPVWLGAGLSANVAKPLRLQRAL